MGEVEAGWWADPDVPGQLRYWSGTAWTEHVAAGELASDAEVVDLPHGELLTDEDLAAGPAAAVGKVTRSFRKGATGVRKLSTAAAGSAVGQKAAGAAIATGKVVAETVSDAEKRQAVARAAAPTYNAALVGAGVRNRKGKIKLWRVGLAAIRPRKTLTRVAQEVGAAGGDQVLVLIDAAADAARAQWSRPDDYYSLVEIGGEWPDEAVDVLAQRWVRGYERLAADDDGDLDGDRSALTDVCAALAAWIKGVPAIANDDDAVATVVLALAIVLSEPNAERWPPDDPKILRLCLAVARVTGMQPVELGGNDELAMFFDDDVERMRLAMAISRGGWSADLAQWFTLR